MQPVAHAVRKWCRGSSWSRVGDGIIDAHRRTARGTFEADFSRIASSISGVEARVRCWPEEDCMLLAQDFEFVGRDEFWLAGLGTHPPASTSL